jgi:hypothetical protein
VTPLPLAVAEVPADEVPGVEELAPGVVWLPGAWLGVAEFGGGEAVSGEVWPGCVAFGADDWPDPVDGWLVLGFDVCGLAPDGLLCVGAGAEPEGVVLSGLVVCAKTQLADSSNKASSVALAFMAVSRLRYDLVTYRTVGAIPSHENPADSLGSQQLYRMDSIRRRSSEC